MILNEFNKKKLTIYSKKFQIIIKKKHERNKIFLFLILSKNEYQFVVKRRN